MSSRSTDFSTVRAPDVGVLTDGYSAAFLGAAGGAPGRGELIRA